MYASMYACMYASIYAYIYASMYVSNVFITLHSTPALKLKCVQNIRSSTGYLLPYFCLGLGFFNYRPSFKKFNCACALKCLVKSNESRTMGNGT